MRRALLFVLIAGVACFAKDPEFKAEDVVAHHLDSIGTAQARAAARSRVAQGACEMNVIVGGGGHMAGDALLVSLNRKANVTLKFPSTQYPGEQFVVDGNNVLVATTGPNTRSSLGDFIYRHDEILKEGLLGGSLFTSWSLLDVSARQPRLKYEGLKKVNDQMLHVLRYKTKKSSDELSILLYFDPETFRHVMTVYTHTVAASMSMRQTSERRRPDAHADEVRYRLEESFADFRTVDGLTLPQSWKLRYTVEPVQPSTLEWNINVSRLVHNTVTD